MGPGMILMDPHAHAWRLMISRFSHKMHIDLPVEGRKTPLKPFKPFKFQLGLTIVASCLIAFATADTSHAQVTTFTNRTAWLSALAGAPTQLIDFQGLPNGTLISNQYAPQGVRFLAD